MKGPKVMLIIPASSREVGNDAIAAHLGIANPERTDQNGLLALLIALIFPRSERRLFSTS
jgi:hypothetical protein